MIEWDEFDAQARTLVAVLNASEARRGTGALWRYVPARSTNDSYLRRSPTPIRIPDASPVTVDVDGTCDLSDDLNDDDDDDDGESDPAVALQQTPEVPAPGWTAAQCEWHVLWSSAFRVPVVHYSLAAADGSALAFAAELAHADRLAAAHGGPQTLDSTPTGAAAYITSGEHPVLGAPFWFLHPCRTAAAMDRLAALAAAHGTPADTWRRTHYLAAWLSWAAPMVGLTVDVSQAFL